MAKPQRPVSIRQRDPGPPARRAEAIGAPTADRLSRLLGASADIVLVLDRDTTVRDVTIRSPDLSADLKGGASWVGRSWLDTMTVETRPKGEALIDAAFGGGEAEPQLRHINHLSGRPADVAVEYSLLRFDEGEHAIAFGRDLRPLVALQQRLVDAQASLERDYAELRNTEARYRMLFDETPEPLFVLDARTARIRETNPAGRRLGGAATLPGANFTDGLEPRSRAGFTRFLANVRSDGQVEPIRVRLAASRSAAATREILLAGSLLIEEDDELVLMRVAGEDGTEQAGEAGSERRYLDAVAQSPDAFVFADADACVLGANNTFLELTGLPSIDRARGRRIDNWLGETGVDFDVLFANLRQRGAVRLFSTRLRSERRRTTEVEVSAVALAGADKATYGFAIRDVSRRMSAPGPGAEREPPRSVEQMSELVGRVPLKDLVRDATDVIERLSIEAALELTNDNRASAAEMLGLSRQSLYVKLRRYGIGDLGEADPA